LKDFKAGSLKHQCPDTSGGHDGNVAWLVASCNMQDTTPDVGKPIVVVNKAGGGGTRGYILSLEPNRMDTPWESIYGRYLHPLPCKGVTYHYKKSYRAVCQTSYMPIGLYVKKEVL